MTTVLGPRATVESKIQALLTKAASEISFGKLTLTVDFKNGVPQEEIRYEIASKK